LRFLEQPEIKSKYHRLDKDSKNFGRIFVYFKFRGLKWIRQRREISKNVFRSGLDQEFVRGTGASLSDFILTTLLLHHVAGRQDMLHELTDSVWYERTDMSAGIQH
jgi:hypothetical protein